MSFKYLILLTTNDDTEDYHIRKPNDKNFLFEIEDKNCFYVGEDLISFETNDKIINYSSELGYNDVIFPFAYFEENIYFILHRK